jgi:hypothetical protein
MNEQILKLAKQSGLVLAGDWGMKKWEGSRSESISDKDLEKFAELIIRECASIVENAVDHREPASTYVNKIKEHFGVSDEPLDNRVRDYGYKRSREA